MIRTHSRLIHKVAVISLGIILGSLSGSIVLSFYVRNVSPPSEVDLREETTVSWAKGYGSLRELVEDSDVVVLGEVINSFVSINTYGPWATKYVHTVYEFRVERVILAEVKANEVLTLNHTGGIVNGAPRQVIREDPPLNVGERLILFLVRARYSDSDYLHPTQYFILGPWGRFVVVSERVYSLGSIFPATEDCSLHVDGADLESFTLEILSNA